MLTTEIPTTAAACHEGHPDSIVGFTLSTLAGTAGFGHRYLSMTVGMSFRDMISIRSTLITHWCLALHLKRTCLARSHSDRNCHRLAAELGYEVRQTFRPSRLVAYLVSRLGPEPRALLNFMN